MIYTNQVHLTFCHEAIARNYVIYRVDKETGDYSSSLLTDAAIQQCGALSVLYKGGNTCFLLCRRADADRRGLSARLEEYEADIKIHEIASEKLYETDLAQLLFNALPGLLSEECMCSNLTGKLYYQRPEWVKRKGAVIYVLRLQLTWDYCVKMQVVTFRKAGGKKQTGGKPRYLIDRRSGVLRRVLKTDTKGKTIWYEQGTMDKSRHNQVEFLAFDDWKNYRKCRVGVLDEFSRDVRELLGEYLTMEWKTIEETAVVSGKKDKSGLEKLRKLLRDRRVLLEDTVGDPELEGRIAEELKTYSDINVYSGTLKPGDVLLRIVHEKEYYQDDPQSDPYGQISGDNIVQHVTAENFMTEQRSANEDAALRKVIQELGIKLDLAEGRLQFYDWPALGYPVPVAFVTAKQLEKKTQHYCFDRLWVMPDGSLRFDSWDNLWPAASEDLAAIEAAFQNRKGEVDHRVKGVIYEDIDQMQIIRDTDRLTLPDMEELHHRLDQTRSGDELAVEPLRDILRRFPAGDVRDRMLAALEPLGVYASRQQIRKIVTLRSNLGKSVNTAYYQATGCWIAREMKDTASREEMFGGILDIRYFEEQDKGYYYAGYRGSDLQRSIAKACVIREVSSSAGDTQMERYLPLMAVDFVRVTAWTVLPFPFKYIREWRAKQDLALRTAAQG